MPAKSEPKLRLIYDTVLKESPHLDGGNFTAIHTSDLKRLFNQYDSHFFKAKIGTTLGDVPLRFRLSKRMTKSAGKMTHAISTKRSSSQFYEISVSTTLLFQCFAGDDHRPISTNGIPCHDRMEALQRIMEHELVHVIEMLLWTTSSCSAGRFQSIASRFFGHTEHTHKLITPTERALATFGIKPAQVFGAGNEVQRCRNHKLRNVVGHLPNAQHDQARATLRAAWKLEAKEGLRKLDQYASWLQRDWPDAAASVREGLDEIFTVNRLGLPASLRTCLTTTNIIDSTHSGIRQRTGRVTNWKNGEMARRWSAVAFVETEKNYRRITGYEHLWMLKAHLDRDDDNIAEMQKVG